MCSKGVYKNLVLKVHKEAIARNGSASDEAVGPLVDHLIAALSTANAEISSLSPSLVKSQVTNVNETAEMLASIITA